MLKINALCILVLKKTALYYKVDNSVILLRNFGLIMAEFCTYLLAPAFMLGIKQ
jgi:hypothetical protein